MNNQGVEQLIGRRIQKIRKSRGITQQQFAEMIDISTNYLSDVERGKSSVRLDKLILMMNLLECSADDIFADVVDQSYKVVGSALTKRIDALSVDEREGVYEVMEKVVEFVENISADKW